MKFGFVVLHYKTTEDTIECVESLLKLTGNACIIIVDNFSNNGSLEKLEENYCGNTKIVFVCANENLGFARGNNLGIRKASELGCDSVVLLNNDTIINDTDFMVKCAFIWKKYRFAVCGPRIRSLIDGMDQSPFIIPRHFIKSKKDAFKLFLLGAIKYYSLKLGLPEWWGKSSERISLSNGLQESVLTSDKTDFLICGAAIILGPTYFERFNQLCDKTFLYEEETIIYLLSNLLDYCVIYHPDLEVLHKEQSSTKLVHGTGREKLLFGYGEDYKSRKQVMKIMFHSGNTKYLESLLQRGSVK